LERIVRNLVSNAVRYTPQGRVLVGARRRGTLVLVQVWDTGPGIPLDQQERVFQEYYQLANPERDRTKGLGLGLAIVRRLTALLDCRLTLRSQPGRGSCFEVAMRRAAAPPSIPITEAEPMQSFPVHGLIVVIDDDIAIREAASRLLKGWGYDVIAAGSGEEARQRLEAAASPPDLLICDYRLRDGENGIALIEQLRACYVTEIPAMLVTGDTAPDRLAEAQASGLLLLHKPVSNSKLRASISNLINKIGGTVPVPPNPPSIPGAQSQIRDLAGD
jgi:CheY-like chemotaxis protein/anti-sigma regulatory factor (Ser/Thr protein kinase)